MRRSKRRVLFEKTAKKKECSICRIKQKFSYFTKDKWEDDGLKICCRKCGKEKSKQKREINVLNRQNENFILPSNKLCPNCNTEKEIELFSDNKGTEDGKSHMCKQCFKDFKNIHETKEKIKIYNKKYCQEHKEETNNYQRVWKKNNRTKINARKKVRRETEPLYKFTERVRSLINSSISKNGYKKNSKTAQILGCTFKEFQIHIQKQFESWMNWDNHGVYKIEGNKVWHLDHIKPTALGKISEEETLKLNHYTNFQPLEALNNIRKSNHF